MSQSESAPPDEEELEELSDSDLEALAEPDPEPFPVTYSGSDFDVEGLVRRMTRRDNRRTQVRHGR